MVRVPKYRVRRDRDIAYVEMNGRRITLPGQPHSPESQDAYRRAVNEYLRQHAGSQREPKRSISVGLTIEDLVLQWLDHCKGYYATANTRSNSYGNCRYAVRPLVALYGGVPVVDFRAAELEQVRTAMISGRWGIASAKKGIQAWSRSYANGQVAKLKQMFRWGVKQGIVPAENAAMIEALEALKRGRTFAREADPVGPVDAVTVAATLPHLPPVVRAMVELQQITGMRSDNLCALRPMDVDQSGPVWVYRPAVHKGSHIDQALAVLLGPRCQEVLGPYMGGPPDAPCFSPRAASRRRSPGGRFPGTRYTTGTYRNAIRRACKRARLPHWHPHQLRHVAADAAKRLKGLEGARAYLGHSAMSTTELYESRDLALGLEIARAIG